MPFKFTKKLTLLTSQELRIANCGNMRTDERRFQSSHKQRITGRFATFTATKLFIVQEHVFLRVSSKQT